jgi:hypothetical protein
VEVEHRTLGEHGREDSLGLGAAHGRALVHMAAVQAGDTKSEPLSFMSD